MEAFVFSRIAIIIAVVLVVVLVAGGIIGLVLLNPLNLQSNQSITSNANSQGLDSQFVSVYQNARDSVVLIRSITNEGTVQGSGFVVNYNGDNVIVTNYHVIKDSRNLSVTFSNSQGYAASVLGSDPSVDLAVLSVNAPSDQFYPLTIANSSTLQIGEAVLALGGPYGLAGSLSSGIVSALGRSLTEEQSGINFVIPNVIQVTAPINPGNSGGPLLNIQGQVVGITTAVIADSQGLGFAVPSNTITREIGALIQNGTYTAHSYLGVSGEDNNYFLAQTLGISITYGEIVRGIQSGGPAAGKLMVNDVIISLNGTTIAGVDALAGYLAEKTLPGDTLVIGVVRNQSQIQVNVVLQARPSTA